MSDGPFHFPRRERLGIIIWTLLALLIWWLPQWYPEPALEYEFLPVDTASVERAATEPVTAFAEPSPRELRPFDPNTITREELVAFGLSERAAKGWVNYRRAAGDYADLAALRRVRAIPAAELDRLAPYLRFSTAEEQVAAFAEWETDAEADLVAAAPEYFAFDPNTVTAAELLRLGLTEREATSFGRYRSAGAEFRRPEDWLRIRAVAADKLEALVPYLELPSAPADESVVEAKSSREPATYGPTAIDINRASSADWRQLPGIGEYWSGRILAFRRALGGFVEVEQIAETRGLPDSVFQRIRPFLQTGEPITPIPINHVTEEELARHPYVSRRQATVLIAFRTQRHRLTAEDFTNFKAMDAAARARLLPYLSFE